MEEKKQRNINNNTLVLTLLIIATLSILPFISSTPTGPTDINITANETGPTISPIMVNISGGIISTFNITANTQNPHWKAFVGDVNGQFTLDDASGSTIYDWTLAVVSGEIYATRASGAIGWSSIFCATAANITAEDTALAHTGTDNITSTFSGVNAQTFVTAGVSLAPGSCPAINTYVNNVSQGADFEEILIHDGTNLVYSTIIEPGKQGFDGNNYDFQMIVAENGSQTWASSTAYYIYIEIS